MSARVAVLALIVSLAGGSAGAATDTALVAHGKGTLVEGSPPVSCNIPVTIAFAVRSNQAIYSEDWGPGRLAWGPAPQARSV